MTIRTSKPYDHIANPDDFWESEGFWPNYYIVSGGTLDCIRVLVNAEHEQDALDFFADWAEDHAPGLIVNEEDIERDEETREELDVFRAGNNCVALSIEEIHIEKVQRLDEVAS